MSRKEKGATDLDKLNAHPFIQQVMADAERLAAPVEENVQTGPPSPAPAEQPDTEKVAEYLSDRERIAIFRYPNGKFYNHYGYNEQIEVPNAVAGGFDTFEVAQATVDAPRPKAEKVSEPVEMAVDMARDTDSAANGRIPDREVAAAPSAPRPRANMSPPVLHPEQTDRHDHHITDDALGVGTPSERYAA